MSIDEQNRIFREHDIEWDNEKVARLWGYYARTPPYANVYFSKVFGYQILHSCGLPLREPLEVLDFGCGLGFIWDHLSKLNTRWQYTAVDFSADSVIKVLAKAHGHPHFKGAQHIEVMPTTLPNTHFDVILLVEVIEHLSDLHLHDTLNEITRLLKPGGVVIITTPNDEDISSSRQLCPECGAVFHVWQHVRSWNASSISQHLQLYGLKLRMLKTLDFATQGFSAHSMLVRIKRMVWRVFKGRVSNPHLIAVFQKP